MVRITDWWLLKTNGLDKGLDIICILSGNGQNFGLDVHTQLKFEYSPGFYSLGLEKNFIHYSILEELWEDHKLYKFYQQKKQYH